MTRSEEFAVLKEGVAEVESLIQAYRGRCWTANGAAPAALTRLLARRREDLERFAIGMAVEERRARINGAAPKWVGAWV